MSKVVNNSFDTDSVSSDNVEESKNDNIPEDAQQQAGLDIKFVQGTHEKKKSLELVRKATKFYKN